MTESWPQPLSAAIGPMPGERIDAVAAGMGTSGPATTALIAGGHLPPDLLCSMGLFILARQAPSPTPAPAAGERARTDDGPAKVTPITGSVWVREQCTIHSPLTRDEAFRVEGENLSRFVRRGRRYMSSIAQTWRADGQLATTNLTTGLTSYRKVDGLADSFEGVDPAEVAQPVPNQQQAAQNPHRDRIRMVRPGETLTAGPTVVTLAMMAARDTASSDNPIHSDLEQARAAGLDRPIAGGNHVLSFALEPLLEAWGPQSLSHGALLDTRWKAPTYADDAILVTGTVTSADPHLVVVDVAVELLDADSQPRATAMETTVSVPLGP